MVSTRTTVVRVRMHVTTTSTLFVQSAILVFVMKVERILRSTADDLMPMAASDSQGGANSTRTERRHQINTTQNVNTKHERQAVPSSTAVRLQAAFTSVEAVTKLHPENRQLHATPLDEEIFLHPERFEIL